MRAFFLLVALGAWLPFPHGLAAHPAPSAPVRSADVDPAAPQDKARADALWQQGLILLGQNRRVEALERFEESLTLWSDDVRQTYAARIRENVSGLKRDAQAQRDEAYRLQQENRAAAVLKYRLSLQLWPDPALETYVRQLEAGAASGPPPPLGAARSPSPPSSSVATAAGPTGNAPKPESGVAVAAGRGNPPKPVASVGATAAGAGNTSTPTAAPNDVSDKPTPLAPRAIIHADAKVVAQIQEILAPFATALHYVAPRAPEEPSILRVVFLDVKGEFLEELMSVDAGGSVAVSDVSAVSHGRDAARVSLILQQYGGRP
jgi:hypothetical protein